MKKIILFSSILFLVLSVVFLQNKPIEQSSVSAQSATDTWPQLQYDAHRSGYVPQTVVPPYTKLWEVRYKVSSRVQPIIGPNHIYLPANDNKMYAINKDGSLAWSFDTEGPNVNSAGYENGVVFFGSTDNYIYAVNDNDGTLKWKYKTGSTVKTAPLLANGNIYMGSSDGNMYAIKQDSGDLIWSYNIGAPIYDTAAFDNNTIFFGGMDSKAYALQANVKGLVWSKQLNGQGFRDRWTVAGNGYAFFTPMLSMLHHDALAGGIDVIKATYTQNWAVQKQAIIDHLVSHPYYQPLHVLSEDQGSPAFTPPVLYASGGGGSPHSQVVLLPNNKVDVIYRRSFGEEPLWGSTTLSVLVSGEMDLSSGDIAAIDQCGEWGNTTCTFASPFTSDESAALVRSGDVLYLDIARGTLGMDTRNKIRLSTLACYNPGSGGPFCGGAPVIFNDYCEQNSTSCTTSGGGWRVDYGNIYAEVDSDGNDLKRPTPIVGDTFYILHYGSLIAVRGTLR